MRHLTPLLAAAASVLSTAPAYADLGDQLFKLLAKDGAPVDLFGRSVAIGGAIAIVGAYQDDNDNGIVSGSAYLFDTTTGWQLFKLLPNDGADFDGFGWSVAISGPPGNQVAIVGAFGDDDNGPQSGSAYLFDISDPANPMQLFKLLPDDGADSDNFGWSVAISGTTAIVGALGDDDNGTNSGSAYLFDTTTGRQLFKLLPGNGATDDLFGYSVAISPPRRATAIVGAPGNFDAANGADSGSAYLFDTTTGRQIAKLLPDDGAADDHFGISVAISGATAIVGSPNDDDNGAESGSAYLFDITTGRQLFKLLASDGAAGDEFGWSVAISGETAIVGAQKDDDNGSNSGSAYLFDISDPANPTQLFKLLANDGAAVDIFGVSVAISGAPGKEVAIVGASLDDDNGFASGSAYLFDAAAPVKCPWDLNGSGDVGVLDLLALLAAWGPCPGCWPPAPWCGFDDDCIIGILDLLILLANWGPCA